MVDFAGIVLVYRGETFHCKPTFAVVSAIEQATGKPMFTLGMEAANAVMPIQQMVFVVQQMLASAGRDRVRASEIGEWIVAEGAKAVNPVIMKFCLTAFGGPDIFSEDKQTPLSVATPNQLQ